MIDIKPLERKFVSKDLSINTWADLKPYADDLLNRDLNSLESFEQWLQDANELEVVMGEDFAWRVIKPTLNTADGMAEQSYNDWMNLIQPEATIFDDKMRRKALVSPYTDQFKQTGFALLKKRWNESNKLFREENIPLQTEEGIKGVASNKIKGAMTVELDGETLTLQQAGARLEWQDRTKREEAWRAVRERMIQDKDALDANISELVPLRHKIAQNAGFANYRDYKFKSLQRFDYTPTDCFRFHDAIESEILPLLKQTHGQRAKSMELNILKPWDLGCDPLGRTALKAFATAEELIEKGIAGLAAINQDLADTVIRMHQHKYLDLESRPNKAPGGYNIALPESKTSFMFYNVVGRASDVDVFVHEAGHAAHNYLMRDLSLEHYKAYPMEVAELASMSLELLAHDELYRFFPDEGDLHRAQYDHLASIVGFFPHMARVDAFQHKLYEHPEMTAEQRHDVWEKLQDRYDTDWVDWSEFKEYRRTAWHSQGHIFEVPFYYIEYGIAQLGALQVWRNYKTDKKQALAQYKAALALGYTKSIPDIYETAGIKFDFSAATIKELMAFVQKEMAKLV